MTKLAYLDCPTGIAGDMCLGALVAAGLPLEYLTQQLQGLGIAEEYQLRAQSVYRNGQLATKVDVEILGSPKPDATHKPHHAHAHELSHSRHTTSLETQTSHSLYASTRHLPEIEQLITVAALPPRVTEWSLAVFRKLAEAEGAVHGIAPEQVHFHEVGATDAIVDIVGTCLGLDWLGIEQLYCSALPTGGGTVRAAHGQLPVPVPAVLKLWESRQVPVYSNGIERELVTPTGAALAVTLATRFGAPPPMTIQCVGQGAGSSQLSIPNILRLWIGESGAESWGGHAEGGQTLETIAVLETQIDDLNPQAIGYVFEALLKVGALDVFTQAIAMKKSRPGVLLTVICLPEQVATCEAVLFSETTTLGIRRLSQQRAVLHREIKTVQTEYGSVRVKIASRDPLSTQQIVNVQPEYEDCAAIARQHQLPWRAVHQLALDAWQRQHH